MQAKDLIEILQNLDPETVIYMFDSGGQADIVPVVLLEPFAPGNVKDPDTGKWVLWDYDHDGGFTL